MDLTLFNNLLKNINNVDDLVIVCVGTDSMIADMVGPTTGTFLKEINIGLPVYGTLDDPIHALNVREKMENINKIHPNATIIGIDSGVGLERKINKIVYQDKPLNPGKGVGKKLTTVGQHRIIGIVSSKAKDLHAVRYRDIYKLSKEITETLSLFVETVTNNALAEMKNI